MKRVPIRPSARAAKLALYKDLAQRQGAVGDLSAGGLVRGLLGRLNNSNYFVGWLFWVMVLSNAALGMRYWKK